MSMLYGIPPIPYTTPGTDSLTSGGGGGGPPLSNANPQPLGTPAPGVSPEASRADHVHQMPDLGDLSNVSVPLPNNGDVLSFDLGTSTWIATAIGAGVTLSSNIPQPLGVASAGTGTQASRDDHVHQMPDLGDLSDVSAAAPADGDILAYDLGTTTWVTVAPLALSSAVPQALGVASAGTGTQASRDDHVHQMPALGDLSNVSVPLPNNGDVLSFDTGTSTWIATAPAATGWPNVTGTDINGRVYEQALASTADTSIILTPTGTGALQAQVADNAVTGGNARGAAAVDWQQVRTAATQVASGINAVIGGGFRNTASSNFATVGGGRQNLASASTYVTVGGGFENTASGGGATVGGGESNTASSTGATVAGGYDNTASQQYATVGGGYYGLANQYGMFSHASGRFAAQGDAQYSRMILRRQTTDATPTVLSADGNAPGASTRFALPNNACFTFFIQVSARQNATGDTAWWKFDGCIKRGASAAATALVGSVYQTTDADAGAATWAVSITADTTNGALQVEVTGELAKTIRWVATVHVTQVAG